MYNRALFPGVTISPVVPDVTLVILSTPFTLAAHLSFHVMFELEGKLQTHLPVSLVDLSGGFHH